MKRILAVIVTIFALSLLSVGCSQSPNTLTGQSTTELQQSSQPAQPAPSTQQSGSSKDNQDLKKLSQAELDAQAEKIQAEIDKMLADLDNDNDAANLAKEE